MRGSTPDFRPQPLGRNIDPAGLSGYYCDLRHKALDSISLDPTEQAEQRGFWVIAVSQTALGFWELRIAADKDPRVPDDEAERQFLGFADWLLANHEDGAGGILWRTGFPVPKYDLAPGWISAMGQGQAISVLLRAQQLTGRDEYLETARAALAPMTVPVREGGVQVSLDGVTVLEEYPTRKPSAVLNGWIFALFGVHELAVVTGDPEARELFERSAAGLISLLPRYDIGWWTLYSLYDHGLPDLAKPFYQRLHPVLLEGLSMIHPAPALSSYAESWHEQYRGRNVARASLNKLAFRVRRTVT